MVPERDSSSMQSSKFVLEEESFDENENTLNRAEDELQYEEYFERWVNEK